MKRIIFALAAAMICLAATAQEQASRTMRIFYGGQVVYMRDVAQMDSINFLLNAGEGGDEGTEEYFTDDLGGGVTLKMRKVEGGTFSMGATSEQGSDAYDREKPVHTVTLDGFYMGETEITQAQWYAVMGTTLEQQRDKANPSFSLYGKGDNYPMYYVSWEEAQAFCAKLSEMTGRNYVLPTEAQWEYAARGGKYSKGTKYAGSNTINEVAWYTGNSNSLNHPVAQKESNELGLYDMSGNVSEWCLDRYGSYSSSSATNPTGPSAGSDRVSRGGSWYGGAVSCRVSYRNYDSPGNRYSNFGFRVVVLP
ncbi:MAG: formylglycine-generating enzyme family protein [Lentimicrobiaceae bacterium]|nr:formylglycine-generating enzyme family protein [Lentimicrobiaceae bacterium]